MPQVSQQKPAVSSLNYTNLGYIAVWNVIELLTIHRLQGIFLKSDKTYNNGALRGSVELLMPHIYPFYEQSFKETPNNRDSIMSRSMPGCAATSGPDFVINEVRVFSWNTSYTLLNLLVETAERQWDNNSLCPLLSVVCNYRLYLIHLDSIELGV